MYKDILSERVSMLVVVREIGLMNDSETRKLNSKE
jgi:hypothetical protein